MNSSVKFKNNVLGFLLFILVLIFYGIALIRIG